MTFYRCGQFIYQRRVLVVVAWVIFGLVAVPFAARVGGTLKVGGFTSDSMEASRAIQTLTRGLDFKPTTLSLIYSSTTWPVTDPRFVAAAQTAADSLRAMPEVAEVVPYTANPRQVAANGHTAYSLVVLNVPPEGSQRLLPTLERLIGTPPPEMTVSLAGGPVFYADIERTSAEDLRKGEVIAFPLALVALLLVFGSVVAALTPVVVGAFSVIAILACLFLIGQVTDISIFALNLATMLGLGLAVDYALFVTSRYREEAREHQPAEAVARAVATAGRSIFFSGLTVLVGLSALIVFPFMFLRSVGVAGVLVVFFSVAAALTLLPAVLGILGPRVDALSIGRPRERGARGWHALALGVMRHPWRFFLPTLAFLVLLGTPLLHIRLSSPDASILPTSVPSRRAWDLLRQNFAPGELEPVVIAVQSPPGSSIYSPANLTALYTFTNALAADRRVARVDSIVTLDPRLSLEQYRLIYQDPGNISDPYARQVAARFARGNVALVTAVLVSPAVSDDAKSLVRDVRSTSLPGGLTAEVTGTTAGVIDVVTELYRDFPRALLGVVLATYLILFLLLRSLLLPLKAIVMNALSLLAAYGALVWVFQDGNLSTLLGFAPLGFVEASLPIVMFCTLFGVSMDYEVFLLSRIREAYIETGQNDTSVARGLEQSGRIITSAALIVVVVAGSFVTASIVLVKALGLGVALAVLLDATVIRVLLVPATMRLLGEWNWYEPRWMGRLVGGAGQRNLVGYVAAGPAPPAPDAHDQPPTVAK